MRIGRVRISQETFCNMLDFPDGEIKNVSFDDLGNIVLSIRHYDMPEVPNGGEVPFINPTYAIHENSRGERLITRESIKMHQNPI